MSLAQGDNPEAAGPSGEQRGRGRGGGRSKGSRSVQYQSGHELDDDERLIRLSSTIAAAEAERASLQKRVAEKATLRNLEVQLAEQARLTEEAERRADVLQQERNNSLKARQEDEAAFNDKLQTSHNQVQGLDNRLAGLTNELQARDDELAHYHANNREMVKQVSSLTSQINQLQNSLDDEMTRVDELQKLQRDFAFRESESAEENHSLKQEVQDQAATIGRLQAQVDRFRLMERQAANVRPMPMAPSMYGPVGGPRGSFPGDPSFFHGYPPHSQFPPSAPAGYMTSGYMTSRPMPPQPMMSMGYAPGPPHPAYRHPTFPQSLSADPSQQVFGSNVGDTYSEEGSGPVAHSPGATSSSPRHASFAGSQEHMSSQAPSDMTHHEGYQMTQDAGESMHEAAEPVQAFDGTLYQAAEPVYQAVEPVEAVTEAVQATAEPMQTMAQSGEETPVDGQAFLAKLQKKGLPSGAMSQLPAESSNLPAVHSEAANMLPQVSAPPVQTSRSAAVGEEAVQEAADEAASTADVDPAAHPPNHTSMANEPTSDGEMPTHAEPPRPKHVIYITPFPPGHVASLPADQQQALQSSINALFDPQPLVAPGVSDVAGKYIIPLPAQTNSNRQTGEVQMPRRDQSRHQRGQGNQRGGGQQRNRGNQQNRGVRRGQGVQRRVLEQQGPAHHDTSQVQQSQPTKTSKKQAKKGRKQQGASAGIEQKAPS